MIDWSQAIDLYCERTGVGFWNEPLNALSNLSFVFAGCFGLWRYNRLKSFWVNYLSALSILVGIGSFLFHTFANRWSHLADIIPIAIFMASFFAFTLRHILNCDKLKTTIGTILFVGLSILVERYQPRHLLNGSLGYIHGILFLILISIYLKKIKHTLWKNYFLATGVFIIALSFRTIDHGVCTWMQVGTHFLWHLTNGILLGILIIISATCMLEKNHES